MFRIQLNYRGVTTVLAATILSLQCSNVSLKSLESSSELNIRSGPNGIQISNPKRILNTIYFFNENFAPGGFCYAYPHKSMVSITDTVSQNGIFSAQITLDISDYSGGAISLGSSVDLTAYKKNGALKFWIKGKTGGEKAWIALVDQSRRSREKAAVRLPLSKYTTITKESQQVCIPLIDFKEQGSYWDSNRKAEIPCEFDWSSVSEFRIEIKKGENRSFTVFLDDICIEPNAIDTSRYHPDLSWDNRIESVYPPRSSQLSKDETILSFFDGGLSAGSYTYVYGGNTACVLQKNAMYSDRKIMTCYLDNNDYSAVTIVTDQKKTVDLKDYRKTGGLVFWAKVGFKTSSIQVGFLDHQKDERKVQSRVSIEQYGELSEDWKMFSIPLRHFSDIGLYWDEKLNLETEFPIDWKSIHEIRFSCVKSQSDIKDTVPVILYLENISIVKDITETSDFEKYWNSFQSTESELTLHNFQDSGNSGWVISKGPKSGCSISVIDAPANAPANVLKCMSFTYSLMDWCDLIHSYTEIDSLKRNWTKHWGIRFHLYTEKEFQGITIQIADSTNEHFVANVGALRGWNDIIVPFREFSKFIYFQPDDAIHNNRLDLNAIKGIAFKASGNNTFGKYLIANVRLTNERDSKTVLLSE